jgi:hypothetical protein
MRKCAPSTAGRSCLKNGSGNAFEKHQGAPHNGKALLGTMTGWRRPIRERLHRTQFGQLKKNTNGKRSWIKDHWTLLGTSPASWQPRTHPGWRHLRHVESGCGRFSNPMGKNTSPAGPAWPQIAYTRTSGTLLPSPSAHSANLRTWRHPRNAT